MRKIRNNTSRIKKSFKKIKNKLEDINKKKIEEKRQAQEILLEEEKKSKRLFFLESLSDMSYNEARKLAVGLGISIYQRKKADIIEEIRQHYDQSDTTH